MEFGIFIQGHLPGPQAHNSEAEHRMLFDEVELVTVSYTHLTLPTNREV